MAFFRLPRLTERDPGRTETEHKITVLTSEISMKRGFGIVDKKHVWDILLSTPTDVIINAFLLFGRQMA